MYNLIIMTVSRNVIRLSENSGGLYIQNCIKSSSFYEFVFIKVLRGISCYCRRWHDKDPPQFIYLDCGTKTFFQRDVIDSFHGSRNDVKQMKYIASVWDHTLLHTRTKRNIQILYYATNIRSVLQCYIKHSLTNAPASVKTFLPLNHNSVGNYVTMFRVRVEAALNIIDERVARIHAVFWS